MACPLAQHRNGELMATTMIVRGSMGAEYRANRNEAKRWRRDGRARGRKANKLERGRPERAPDPDEWGGVA